MTGPRLRPVPDPDQPVRHPRRDPHATPAAIYIPPGIAAASTWRDTCAAYCQRRGYHIAAVVTAWADLLRLVVAGDADVVVVGRRDHLPPKRRPRLEVVTEERMDLSAAQRRPQRLTRPQ